jgi:DNA repair protein RadD
MIQPRSYQIEAEQSLWSYFAENSGNPVIAMPTGTGKSVVIAMFLQRVFAHYPTQKILMITHVKELIEQNAKKLLQLWPTAPLGIYSAGLNRRDTIPQIVFCGVASVAKRAQEFGHVDLVLIDEAHLVSPNQETMYQKFLEQLRKINPDLKIIGLTATPWRLGQGHITTDGIFTDVCFDITGLQAFNRLIAEGFLAPLIPKKTKLQIDRDTLHIRGGEFIPAEIQAAFDKEEITERALDEIIAHGQDRKHWLIFCSGVEHAINVCQSLNERGILTACVYSGMPDEARKEAIDGWKSGKYRAITNNNILTTGIDFPEIDLIAVLRSTCSTVLWVQMLGRGTRPAPGKTNCLVFDFGGNIQSLGPINDPVLPRKKGDKEGTAPIKMCENCETWNHISVRYCDVCGSEFHFQTKLKASASSEELIKGDLPVVEIFDVDHVVYEKHVKQTTGNVSILVKYHCGLRRFKEFVPLEYNGRPTPRAARWWRTRSGLDVPSTVDNALLLCDQLHIPSQLRVWINKDYPEIMDYCFDGTSFGTKQQSVRNITTFVEGQNTGRTDFSTTKSSDESKSIWNDWDDDIPF